MQKDFNIRLSIYMERNGELFCYQSHDDAAWEKEVPVKELVKPKNFITLAEDEKQGLDSPTSSASSTPALESPQPGPVVPTKKASSPFRKVQRRGKQTRSYFEL